MTHNHPPPSARWDLVALLTLTATASYLARTNVSVAVVQMMPEFGLTQEAMGRVFSAFLAGYALMQVPSGMLADRFGPTRVLAIAAFGWIACVFGITAAAGSVAVLMIARFLLGVFEAPTFPSAGVAVSRWVPLAQRGRANGTVIAGIGVGSAIAPLLLGPVMNGWGWRAALWVSTIPALIAGLAWLLVKTPAVPPVEPSTVRKDGRIPRTLEFYLLTLSYTLQGYVGYIFVFWFYYYLVDVRHFDLLRSALFGSLPWLLSIVSIPLGGFIFDRLRTGRRWVPIIGLAGSGLLTAIGAYAPNAYFAAVCMAFATALVLCVEGPFWATMTHLAGPSSGAAGGFMNMGSNIGGLISPALTPILATKFGWEAALLVSAGLGLIGAILWIWIPPAPAK
ncbi:MAG: MFS transporter [Acidobacteria bacterium]|nr:MFS transporter [Acidobacteriota bacterium]